MSNQVVSYLLLSVAALLPVVATLCFFFLEKYSKFKNLNFWAKQIIFGLVFGGLAVVGTEWGIPMNDAQVNCRDAAVLTAGLLFGWPAGIIAGLIGGIERWFSVYWGVAPATQVACSVSTIIAGFYAAALRKFLYHNERPNLIIAFAAGFVMETFHLLMAFITNMHNPTFAYKVVSACTGPMLSFNALSVALSALIYNIADKKSIKIRKIKHQNISTTIQLSLLITCILVFCISSSLIYGIEDNISKNQTNTTLNQTLKDLDKDIVDNSDSIFTILADEVSEVSQKFPGSIKTIASTHYAADINIVDSNGICTHSVDPEFSGVNFYTREDTKSFAGILSEPEGSDYAERYQRISYYKISQTDPVYRKYVAIRTSDGFVRVGYDIVGIDRYLKPCVTLLARNKHVGSSGYALITDSDFKVISCPDTLNLDQIEADISYLSREKDYSTVSIKFNKVDSYCQKANSEGLFIVATIGVEESKQGLYINLYLLTFLQIISYAVLFGLIYVLINSIVLRGFNKVTTSLNKISEGDLNVDVNVESSIEFANLSRDINKTVDTLKNYINEANERIDKELQLAKDIQSSSLPRVTGNYKNNPFYDISAAMFTAKEVGGDFYDFYYNHTYRLNFVIADVSGKGIPASLFMMRSKQELKSLTEANMPIDEVFTKGNKALCEGNDAGMFVTVWQAGIDLRSGDIEFANAGHNSPVVYRASTKRFEFIKCLKGFVMAGLDMTNYKLQTLHLDPGDIIFLYTDGVTEATNSEEKLYGDQRLLNILNSQEFESMDELCKVVKADVDKFVGDAPQFDDITMVAFRFLKKAEK